MGRSDHFRYVIVLWMAVGLFIVTNIELHLPLTILQLTPDYDISKVENSFLLLSFRNGFQAFQWTSFISLLLFANLILKGDSKLMLAIGLGGISLCHLLIPIILPLGTTSFISLCISQGLFHGMILPYFLTVISFWTPIVENTTLISISLFGYWLGLALCNTIYFKLAYLVVPFYLFGALGLCWTVIWLILAKAKPSDDPKMTETEIECILSNGNEGGITILTSSIRKQIFKTKSTLSILAVLLCSVFNSDILTLILTIIGSKKIGIIKKLDDTILFSYLVAAVVMVTFAFVSDYLRQKCCVTKIRKTVICTGLLCSAILIPLIGIYYPENSTYYSVLFGSFVGVQAIILTSSFVNLLDVMHHAAGYALGVFLGITGVIAAVFVIVVSLIKYNGDVLFWVVTVLNVVGCLTYAICGSAKREIWVMNNAEPRTETNIALDEISNDTVTPSNVEIVTN